MRHRAREVVLQSLYRIDLNPDRPEAALEEMEGYAGLSPEACRFSRALADAVQQRREEIDALIAGASVRWDISRMAVVERNVLRLAVCELLHSSETPASVVLNEAIELAKEYGGDDSGTFVNGVLDRVRVNLERVRDEA